MKQWQWMITGLVASVFGWNKLVRAQPLNPSFEHYITDNGLSSNYVTGILKDRRGFMWFSTKYKLYRLHPTTLQLTAYALPRVVDNACIEPFFDRKGQFWLNQAEALYRFDPQSRRYRYYDGTDDAYMLQTNQRTVVPLQNGLDFARAYTDLLITRYGESLHIHLPETPAWPDHCLPPLSLPADEPDQGRVLLLFQFNFLIPLAYSPNSPAHTIV